MPNEPQIQSLSSTRRKILFRILLLVFVVALPALIFYTTGYRLSFEGDETAVVTTGGMYITTDNLEVGVFLDSEQIERPRLFRSAYYVQNIEIGQHRIVVQETGLNTWVKVLPVDPHIVTEVSAFNMPVIPQVRPVSEYVTATGTQVYLNDDPVSLTGVSSTKSVLLVDKISTEHVLNEEYLYVESLFKVSSSSNKSILKKILNEVERFSFSTTTTNKEADNLSSTTKPLVQEGGMLITNKGGEVYAVWSDPISSVPYYFCVAGEINTIGARYGEHVASEFDRLMLSTTTPIVVESDRLCRSEIKLDRKRQNVYFYDFLPGSSDLVLMQLEDGLYVTEIDDRAWQNTQLLYSGADFKIVIENGSVYILDKGKYFELLTEIEEL